MAYFLMDSGIKFSKCFNARGKIMLGFFCVLSSPFACGQYLPEVTVTGSFDGFYNFGTGGGLQFPSGAGEPFSGYGRMMATLNGIKLMEDVRCVGEGFEKTTSHADVADRWIAAEAVYRRVTSGRNLFQKLFGSSPVDPKAAKFLNVTYADGGTETW